MTMKKTKQELCNSLMLLDENKANWHFEEVYSTFDLDDLDEFRIYKNNSMIVEYIAYEGYYLNNIKTLSPDEVYLVARWLDEAEDYIHFTDSEIKEQKEG